MCVYVLGANREKQLQRALAGWFRNKRGGRKIFAVSKFILAKGVESQKVQDV